MQDEELHPDRENIKYQDQYGSIPSSSEII